MLDHAKVVVTNTTPLIALTAATGHLEVLRALYSRVVVPYALGDQRQNAYQFHIMPLEYPSKAR